MRALAVVCLAGLAACGSGGDELVDQPAGVPLRPAGTAAPAAPPRGPTPVGGSATAPVGPPAGPGRGPRVDAGDPPDDLGVYVQAAAVATVFADAVLASDAPTWVAAAESAAAALDDATVVAVVFDPASGVGVSAALSAASETPTFIVDAAGAQACVSFSTDTPDAGADAQFTLTPPELVATASPVPAGCPVPGSPQWVAGMLTAGSPGCDPATAGLERVCA